MTCWFCDAPHLRRFHPLFCSETCKDADEVRSALNTPVSKICRDCNTPWSPGVDQCPTCRGGSWLEIRPLRVVGSA